MVYSTKPFLGEILTHAEAAEHGNESLIPWLALSRATAWSHKASNCL